MIEDAISTADRAPAFRRGRFDLLSIAFHWITLALVIGLFAIAWTLKSVNDEETARLLLMVHRSLGVTVWVLTAARLAWRRTGAHLPPFPPSMPRLQQWAATANEWALYALLLVQPLTGLGYTLAAGRPFPLFGIEVPALIARNRALAHGLHHVHELGATILLALVGLHAAAALLHGLFLRDGVFEAMLPWTRRAPTNRL